MTSGPIHLLKAGEFAEGSSTAQAGRRVPLQVPGPKTWCLLPRRLERRPLRRVVLAVGSKRRLELAFLEGVLADVELHPQVRHFLEDLFRRAGEEAPRRGRPYSGGKAQPGASGRGARAAYPRRHAAVLVSSPPDALASGGLSAVRQKRPGPRGGPCEGDLYLLHQLL